MIHKKPLKTFLVSLCLIYPSLAVADLITYDYTFDTPQFSDFPFGPVNSLLLTAGSTVTGSITLDTDNIGYRSTLWDSYLTISGGLSHSGELDELGFDTQASEAFTPYLPLVPGTILSSIRGWSILDSDGNRLSIQIDFEGSIMRAQCMDFSTDPETDQYDGCAEADYFNQSYAQDRPLSNLSLVQRSYQVPEPGTLALLGIGLLGMAATRRRRKV